MGGGEVRLLGPEGQIWVFFLMSLPLELTVTSHNLIGGLADLGSTHIKNCLNLGIARKGRGVPGLPKFLGALFKDLGISQRGGIVGLPKLENSDF